MKKFLINLILLTTTVFAQTAPKIPRPFVFGGLSLMPGGYSPAAGHFGGGFDLEGRFLANVLAEYDNGRKSNDNTTNNFKGHDRYLAGTVGYKLTPKNFVLVGARWSQLSTTNYTKGSGPFTASSWHPEVGGGHDWLRTRFSARGEAVYYFRSPNQVVSYPNGVHCSTCGNGTQGAEINLWIPSPAKSGHFFFREQVLLTEFHDLNQSNHRFTGSTELSVVFRF